MPPSRIKHYRNLTAFAECGVCGEVDRCSDHDPELGLICGACVAPALAAEFVLIHRLRLAPPAPNLPNC